VGIAGDRKVKRAVFLDRDGVLNETVVRDGKPYPPSDLASLRIIPGTREALARLKERGYFLLGITNQPDVARGNQSRETVDKINHNLRTELGLDDLLTCYHDDADECDCRKPRPGLIHQASKQYGIDLQNSYLIGDRWRDIDAGTSAGCKTILIDYGYRERAPASTPNKRVGTLAEAVDWILTTESM